MITGIFLKIISDSCLFFAILTAFPIVFRFDGSLLFPAAICAAAAALAVHFDRKQQTVPSRLCALLPFAALLLARDMSAAMVIAAPILFTVIVIARGELWLEYFTFRRTFIKGLKFLGVLLPIICVLSYVTNPLGERLEPYIVVGNTVRYGLLHLIFGVILQRELRLGLDNRAHGNISQMTVMLGGTGAVAAGFFFAEPALREMLSALINGIFTIIFLLPSAVLDLLTRMLDEMKESEEYNEAIAEAEKRNPMRPGDLGELMEALRPETPKVEEEVLWWLPLVIIAVVVAMGFLLVAFGKRKVSLPTMAAFSEVSEEVRKKTAPRLAPRARVRQAYRDFLKQEKKRGTKIRKDCTTADILQNLSPDANRAAAHELRNIYLRARYDETREVSRTQADAARTALRRIHEK